MRSERAARIKCVHTIPWIGIEHLLDYIKLLVPVGVLPAKELVATFRSRSIGDIFKTPSTMIPYPVDLWVGSESHHGRR